MALSITSVCAEYIVTPAVGGNTRNPVYSFTNRGTADVSTKTTRTRGTDRENTVCSFLLTFPGQLCACAGMTKSCGDYERNREDFRRRRSQKDLKMMGGERRLSTWKTPTAIVVATSILSKATTLTCRHQPPVPHSAIWKVSCWPPRIAITVCISSTRWTNCHSKSLSSCWANSISKWIIPS